MNCVYCGQPLNPGAAFCGECGKRQDAAPPVAPPRPPAPGGFPAPAPSMYPQQQAYGYGTHFEILKSELFQMPKVTLQNASVKLEAGQLHYMIGNIQMVASASLGGIAKSFLTKEKAVRPVYQGTGEIYLTPTFGECNILDVNGEEWVLDRGCYLASDQGIEVGVFTNKLMSGLFGGEGLFQTKVSGRGKVVYWAQGPIQRIDLQGQTLVVDGPFAVARTASLSYKVERATKGLFGSMISGEGLVNTFQGYGTVMIAPVPNRFMAIEREFGGLYTAIRNIRSS